MLYTRIFFLGGGQSSYPQLLCCYCCSVLVMLYTGHGHSILFSPTNMMYFPQHSQLYSGIFVGVVIIRDSSKKAAKYE